MLILKSSFPKTIYTSEKNEDFAFECLDAVISKKIYFTDDGYNNISYRSLLCFLSLDKDFKQDKQYQYELEIINDYLTKKPDSWKSLKDMLMKYDFINNAKIDYLANRIDEFKSYKIEQYEKRLNNLPGGAGTWENSSYFYDEECVDCGYKSLDYANKYELSYDDFEDLDDYDGFRWQEIIRDGKSCCQCECCFKTTEIANRKKQFPNIQFVDGEGAFNIQLDMNGENENFANKWIGEGNWISTNNNSKIIVNLDFEEGIQCDFLEQLSDYLDHKKAFQQSKPISADELNKSLNNQQQSSIEQTNNVMRQK